MNKALPRLMTFVMAFVLAASMYTPGRAMPFQAALMPAEIVNIAHFYKPPQGIDASATVNNFNTMILSKGDHTFRDQLAARGFSSPIPQYFRTEGIHNPGSCTATPAGNQVGYKAGDFCFISDNHPDWFLLDQYGRRITTSANSSYYRMDPGSDGWRNFFLSRVLESQEQHGWSALFMDNIEGSLSKFYGDIRPAKYPTDAQYQSAMMGFLQFMDVNYSQRYNRLLIGNITARNDDNTWFNYLQYLDGSMQERFAVGWKPGDYLSENKWKNDLAIMEKTQADGKYVILIANGTRSDLERQKFAFASYLLISNGKAAFRYSAEEAYDEVWLYDNYNVDLGSPLGARYQIGTSWRRDFTNGYVVADPISRTATISVIPKGNDISIKINNALMGSYDLASSDVLIEPFAGVQNGPVKVTALNGENFFTSQRALYGGSFNEVMGYPANQFTTEYWFPWYDQVYMNTWILVGNPSSSQTANVDIYIGGSRRGSYSIPPGNRITPQFPGIVDGPVRVVSSNGANIFASERSTYQGSFNEVMGYSARQFTTEYWFPWYDQVYMNTWILVGNPSSSQTANVDIYIGGSRRGSYSIPPGNRITPQFPGIVDGPVRVVSSNGANIFASERSTYQGSFNEVMGYPNNQLATEYWFPLYDDSTMATWILVGNPSSSQTANVDIYVGNVRNSYTIPPNGSITPRYIGITDGPVRVVSTNGVNVFTSERALYGASFNEVMGYPGNQLSSEYWFPWYDSIAMSTNILVGKP